MTLAATALALAAPAPGRAQLTTNPDSAAPVTADSAAPVAARSAGPLRLEVSLAERRLYAYQGESLLASYPVAIGKPNHPTPRGAYQVRRIIWNPRWVPPRTGWARGKSPKEPGDPDNPMGRVKMFFREPDYYIHGTNNEESLGQAASHGCIRMANEDIIELARLAMEHGGESRPPSWYQRVLNFFSSTKEVRLSQRVPLVVRE